MTGSEGECLPEIDFLHVQSAECGSYRREVLRSLNQLTFTSTKLPHADLAWCRDHLPMKAA